MFSLISGLFRYFFSKDEYNILILGLDNSGKTTFLEQVKSNSKKYENERIISKTITPTIGMNAANVTYHSSNKMCFWDLGGQDDLQNLWDKYYNDAHAIIYIIDSTDIDRISDSLNAFKNVISHSLVKNIPLMILINKQDDIRALSPGAIISQFSTIISQYSQLEKHKFFPTAAINNSGIYDSTEWIFNEILKNKDIKPPYQIPNFGFSAQDSDNTSHTSNEKIITRVSPQIHENNANNSKEVAKAIPYMDKETDYMTIKQESHNIQKLFFEKASEIQEWKSEMEDKTKFQDQTLKQNRIMIEILQKTNTDLKIQNENFNNTNRQLSENQYEITTKIETTRNLCHVLKTFFGSMTAQFKLYLNTKDKMDGTIGYITEKYENLLAKFCELEETSQFQIHELEDAIKSKQIFINDLENNHKDENAAKNKQIEELTEIVEELKLSKSKLNEEHQALLIINNTLHNDLECAQDNIRSFENDILPKNMEKILDIETDKLNLMNANKMLKSYLENDIPIYVQSLSTINHDYKKSIGNKMENLNDRFKGLHQHLANLDHKCKNYQQNLQNKFGKLNELVSLKSQQIAEQQTIQDELRQSLKEINEKYQALEMEKEMVLNEKDAAEKTYTDFKKFLLETKSKLEISTKHELEITANLQQYKKQCESHETKINYLNREKDLLKLDTEKLRLTIKAKEEECIVLKNMLDEQRKELETTTSRLSEIQQLNMNLTECNEMLQLELTKQTKESGALRVQQEEYNKLIAEINKYKIGLAETSSQLATLNQKFKKIKIGYKTQGSKLKRLGNHNQYILTKKRCQLRSLAQSKNMIIKGTILKHRDLKIKLKRAKYEHQNQAKQIVQLHAMNEKLELEKCEINEQLLNHKQEWIKAKCTLEQERKEMSIMMEKYKMDGDALIQEKEREFEIFRGQELQKRKLLENKLLEKANQPRSNKKVTPLKELQFKTTTQNNVQSKNIKPESVSRMTRQKQKIAISTPIDTNEFEPKSAKKPQNSDTTNKTPTIYIPETPIDSNFANLAQMNNPLKKFFKTTRTPNDKKIVYEKYLSDERNNCVTGIRTGKFKNNDVPNKRATQKNQAKQNLKTKNYNEALDMQKKSILADISYDQDVNLFDMTFSS